MGTLEAVYACLAKTGAIDEETVHIPYHVTVYVRAGMIDRGLPVPELKELERILYEEGLLPAVAYSVPAWYRKKYRVV